MSCRKPSSFTIYSPIFQTNYLGWYIFHWGHWPIIVSIWYVSTKCHCIYYVILMLRPFQKAFRDWNYYLQLYRSENWCLAPKDTCRYSRTVNWTRYLQSQSWFFVPVVQARGSDFRIVTVQTLCPICVSKVNLRVSSSASSTFWNRFF